ncbi:YihY/virulence factor BrkB family protein [Vineibacter terrae]|uniref:YihY/virulence factor BrkB family protein n=1 Tax=Vineibacter terrae TaxID=2586908 RepID=UPI002E3569D1|nr:YihY/virulence factor BrkB family protein [Vineibacter terrae]HEX2890433.1 YihY/virulence factor BrkB family protein [Vineibacter terrae]
MRTGWALLRSTIDGFVEDEMLSRGAAIAYYSVFALAPVLIIAIAVAGLVFGPDAAQGAIVAELSGLMGERSADVLQSVVRSASDPGSGTWATVIGIGALVVTASGVFSEMQAALNRVWKAKPQTSVLSRLVRARLVSLGLVLALGFLMTISLVVNAGLSAIDTYVKGFVPGGHVLLQVVTFVASFALISLLFAAIYKALPDTQIPWRDVTMGAIVTALLMTLGKSLIAFYLGSSSVASAYGAAGALALMLVWIFYSAQIFLLGAEFTRAYAELRGGRRRPASARASGADD